MRGAVSRPPSTGGSSLDTQKKTFTKWANCYLSKRDQTFLDLFADLRDGVRLMILLEELTGGSVVVKKWNPNPKSPVQMIDNISQAFKFMETQGIIMAGLSANDIHKGDERSCLELMWRLIEHFGAVLLLLSSGGLATPLPTNQVKLSIYIESLLLERCNYLITSVDGDGDSSSKLYAGALKDFSDNWKDGIAFCVLLHRFWPDIMTRETIVNLKSSDDAMATLAMAFETADRMLKVSPLLDVEDVMMRKPDKKTVMTYVYAIFQKKATLATTGDSVFIESVSTKGVVATSDVISAGILSSSSSTVLSTTTSTTKETDILVAVAAPPIETVVVSLETKETHSLEAVELVPSTSGTNATEELADVVVVIAAADVAPVEELVAETVTESASIESSTANAIQAEATAESAPIESFAADAASAEEPASETVTESASAPIESSAANAAPVEEPVAETVTESVSAPMESSAADAAPIKGTAVETVTESAPMESSASDAALAEEPAAETVYESIVSIEIPAWSVCSANTVSAVNSVNYAVETTAAAQDNLISPSIISVSAVNSVNYAIETTAAAQDNLISPSISEGIACFLCRKAMASPDCVILPCTHMGCCFTCASSLAAKPASTCPLCENTPIARVRKHVSLRLVGPLVL